MPQRTSHGTLGPGRGDLDTLLPISRRVTARARPARRLRHTGWTVLPAAPLPVHCVGIFHSHTRDGDFVVTLVAKWALAVRFRWVGKDSLFRWPAAGPLHRLGGIPVNRRAHTGFIEKFAADFMRERPVPPIERHE